MRIKDKIWRCYITNLFELIYGWEPIISDEAVHINLFYWWEDCLWGRKGGVLCKESWLLSWFLPSKAQFKEQYSFPVEPPLCIFDSFSQLAHILHLHQNFSDSFILVCSILFRAANLTVTQLLQATKFRNSFQLIQNLPLGSFSLSVQILLWLLFLATFSKSDMYRPLKPQEKI